MPVCKYVELEIKTFSLVLALRDVALWDKLTILMFMYLTFPVWTPIFWTSNMQNAHGIGLAFFRTNVKHYWQKKCGRWTSWNGDWKYSTKVRWNCFHRIIHKVNAWNSLNPTWKYNSLNKCSTYLETGILLNSSFKASQSYKSPYHHCITMK